MAKYSMTGRAMAALNAMDAILLAAIPWDVIRSVVVTVPGIGHCQERCDAAGHCHPREQSIKCRAPALPRRAAGPGFEL